MSRLALTALLLCASAAGQGAPATRPFVLTVQHFDGSAAAGASVAAVRGKDDVVASGFLDGGGQWRVELPAEELVIYVVGASWQAGEREIAADATEELLKLPGEGGWITGTVDEGGRPPRRPLRVTLHPVSLRGLGLPAAVRRHFSKISASISQVTSTDGAFRFSGVPAEWSGEVRVPADQRLASGRVGVDVSGPTEGLRLELPLEVAVTGVVLDSVSRAPLSGIRVSWKIELAGDGEVTVNGQRISLGSNFSSSSGSSTTGGDGTFKADLSRLGATNINGQQIDMLRELAGGIARSITVQLWNGRDFNLIQYRAEDVDIREGYHFEMDFLEGDDIPLVVVDQDGAPIEGAVARAGWTSQVESEPTDAEGRVELRAVSPELTQVLVGAEGFQEVAFDLPDEIGVVGRVVLPHACTLTVTTLGPDGKPKGNVSVEVTVIDGGLFRGMDGINMGPAQRQAMKGSMRGGSSSYSSTGSTCTMSLASDRDGLVFLPDVSPDLRIIVGLASTKRGEPKWKEEFTLDTGEQKVVELPHVD